MKTNRSAVATGFTLIELLVVIAIIGIVAGIAVPTMSSFKPNITAAATRQLLDDVARARQLAISQRTTVYMIFVPPEFWTDPVYGSIPQLYKDRGGQLYDKQYTGYTFVALRSLGDQPGRSTPRYLAPWKTLPDGTYIPAQKFLANNTWYNVITNSQSNPPGFQVYGFARTSLVPFPTADTPRYNVSRPYVSLPYIAFDYLGHLTSQRNEVIPIARGSVLYPRNPATKVAKEGLPSVIENPPGNLTNGFNVVTIDWLTGRGRIQRQEIR